MRANTPDSHFSPSGPATAQKQSAVAPLVLDERLERIGSHIYDEFRNGHIDFDVCEVSLATLSLLADATLFGIPEPSEIECFCDDDQYCENCLARHIAKEGVK